MSVFPKKKQTISPDVTPAPAEATPDPVKRAGDKTKSGPTRSRREAEAANRVPLVPGDRRAAAKAQRERNRQIRERQYQAMQTGDESALPARDRGPEKRYVRNFVDARRNLGDYFLYIALVFLVLTFVTARFPTLAPLVTLVLYVLVLFVVVDAWFMWRKLRGRLLAKFGADTDVKRVRWYAIMRIFQLRRARLPKPQVKYGEYPN